jgi:peroxiredoxin
MAELDQKKRSRLDSTLGQDPFLGKILALKTYLSFQNHGEGFASEGHYFAQQYFQFVDLTDPDYNRIPHVYEAFLAYAQTLPRVGLTAEQQMQYVDQVLSPLTVGSRTHRMALLGLTYGFRQSANGDAYIRYGEQFIAHYAAQNPAATNQIQSELETQRRLMIGAVAPDIYLPNPEGDSLRLSDLRGKVVLVDFWASWCGPCRRENPNVVRMYNRYQDQGFEIYGVSLDRGKAPWVQAIEKDQLTWLHVCDLRKNRNIAAETYQVSSIPSTFLLDREGRIVAKGLRGQALERKVGELLKIED